MWKTDILKENGGFDRERQQRWDAEHLRTATTKLTVEEYGRLREMCAARNTTVYGLLGKLLRAWMAGPCPGLPPTEKPCPGFPHTENAAQSSTKEASTEESSTDSIHPGGA